MQKKSKARVAVDKASLQQLQRAPQKVEPLKQVSNETRCSVYWFSFHEYSSHVLLPRIPQSGGQTFMPWCCFPPLFIAGDQSLTSSTWWRRTEWSFGMWPISGTSDTLEHAYSSLFVFFISMYIYFLQAPTWFLKNMFPRPSRLHGVKQRSFHCEMRSRAYVFAFRHSLIAWNPFHKEDLMKKHIWMWSGNSGAGDETRYLTLRGALKKNLTSGKMVTNDLLLQPNCAWSMFSHSVKYAGCSRA